MTFELQNYQGNYLKTTLIIVTLLNGSILFSTTIQDFILSSFEARGRSVLALDPTKVLIKKQQYLEESIRIKAFLMQSESPQIKQPKEQLSSQIEQNEGKAVQSYIGQILQLIERNKYYPPRDKMYGNEGSPEIALVIDSNGNLIDSKVVKSCSIAGLDQAALNIVNKAAPYPEFNNLISDDQLSFSVAIEFTLSNSNN